jgi:hypothetical protein
MDVADRSIRQSDRKIRWLQPDRVRNPLKCEETFMKFSRQIAGRLVRHIGVAMLALPALALANADVEKNIANSKNWATQAGS